MTSTLLWTLIAIQIAMAAFDTIYHHELTERLERREFKEIYAAVRDDRAFLSRLLATGIAELPR